MFYCNLNKPGFFSNYFNFKTKHFLDSKDSNEGNPATSTEDTSTVFVKEETPDEKDDSIKTTTTNLEAAGSSSSKPEIKDEPVDDVKETKPTPSKDPLAEAMNEVSTLKNKTELKFINQNQK